jgi:hypothetical protein
MRSGARLPRRTGAVLGAAGLLAACALGVTASTAAASRDPCGAPPPYNYDPGATTVINNNYLHTGPYASCPHVAHPGKGAVVYLHCVYENGYGNGWDHVRIKGTQTQGWISEQDLKHPSLKLCNPWN